MTFFIARDKGGELYLFAGRPQRSRECWWAETGVDGTYLRLNNALFPEVTWDSEPMPVTLQPVA